MKVMIGVWGANSPTPVAMFPSLSSMVVMRSAPFCSVLMMRLIVVWLTSVFYSTYPQFVRISFYDLALYY
jgi:hypothetical protein